MVVESVSHDNATFNHNISCHNSSLHIDTHGTHTKPFVILSLSAGFAFGALLRHAFKRTPIPYTVVLMILGMIFGGIARAYKPLSHYTAVAHMDPHLILYIFLPTLVFESAFGMDVHTFKKTLIQSIILAGPGLGFCTILTALIGRYIFAYDWGWMQSLMFGCIMSATDPVAVVALLKDVGASRQLGTIIEGESLLNDGGAIVLFEVFKAGSVPGEAWSGTKIALYFIRVVLGGPAFGFLMGKLSVFWLSYVFNDALVEITITLASTYFTFYVGETLLHVSGVLAVVTFGIELNSHKANISPEVEVFLHRFWEMMGYLANTLIFILVGVVITEQAFSNVNGKDVLYLVSVYIGIMVIRTIVLGGLSPIMDRFSYGMSPQTTCVIIWGGLRGAVGLVLALLVSQHPGIEEKIGSKVLFHVAGIVCLTLLINATTVKPLLRLLGMSDMSTAQQLSLMAAVRRVRQTAAHAMAMLKEDRFLCDANWEKVEAAVHIDDPYKTEEIEFIEDQLTGDSEGCHCPACDTVVPPVLKPKELAEMAEEARQRYIKAERTSYWKQFEHGMLGREAVKLLQGVADSVMDEPNK
jgi:sodium/hydrogen exchanger 10/11